MKNIIAFLLYYLSITAVVGQVTGASHFQATPTSPGETLLDLELQGTRQTEVLTSRGRAVIIGIEGGTPLLQAGAPDVPKYATTLMIPATGDMVVEIVEASYRDISGVEVAPSKGDLKRNQDPARIPYTYGGAYARDAFFPENLVELQRPFILRDARGQAVWLQPVQYNPVQKILRVYSSLKVRVYATGGSGTNEMRSPTPAPPSRIFRQMQQKLFVNYDPALLHQAAGTAARGGEQPERMLVITKEEFVEGLQPLLEWKRQMGVHTTVVTQAETGGSDPATVQAYIRQRYTEDGISYLLVVGDETAFEPEMRNDGGAYSCDNCYGYMEGDDHFPEILVGRFHAANTEQLAIMVNRNLAYEKSPDHDSTNLGWGTGMWAASNEGQGIGDDGQADYEQANDWKEKQLADGYDKHWEFYDGNHAAISPTPGDESADKSGNPTNTDLVNLMNGRGVSMFNYVGHGWEQGLVSGNFNVEAVGKLRNTRQYPFIIAVACCAGNYTNNGAGDCLGEAWQRAGNPTDGTPWGGIAGFFSSDFQSWAPPMEGQDGMNDMLVNADGITLTPSIGSLLAFGNARMIAAYAQGGELMADFWNPFADPTTLPRTRLPKPVTATHDAGLLIGQSSLVVSSPVEGALVSLYWQGQTLAVGVIENGSTTLNFPPLDNVGALTITLTQFNYVPYQTTVAVVPASGPFVVNQATTLQDASGNANGNADFGETLTYDLRLANVGVETATTIAASLSTSDPNVTLLDAEEIYADLQPDSSLLHPAAFSFRVADLIEDGHVVNFNLKITYNTDKSYETVLPLRLQAPRLSVLSIKVSDLDGGDGDGRLESGEKATVRIKNGNTGKAASLEAIGTLSTTSPWLTISGPATLGPLAAGSLATEAVFSVEVAPNAPQVVLAQLDYAVQAGDYSAARSFGPYTINPIIETFESKGFNQFPWTQSGDKPWLVSSPIAYTGAYSARSGTIGANQKSQMRMTLHFETDGTLSFARRVSCEDGYDFLVFYIDSIEMGRWTGEVAWSEVSYPVTSGIHQLLWSYEKDGLGQQGSDRAWVDDIFMPPYKIVVSTEHPDAAPAVQALVQPNPTSGTSWLRLQLPLQRQQISVEIWDAVGRLVALPMPPSSVPGGEMTQALDLRDLRSGLYFLRVRTESGSVVLKVVRE